MSNMWKRVGLIGAIVMATFSTSSTLVIYNKWLLRYIDNKFYWKKNFPFPLLVTACHMGFIALTLRLIFRYTNWCERPKVTNRVYYYFVVPYSILVALDISLSNSGFLYLEASFVEMIKSSMPAFVLIFSALFGLEVLSFKLALVVVLISGGLSLASYGEVNFRWTGFMLELVAVLIGSLRLVFAQYLLHGKDDMKTTIESEDTVDASDNIASSTVHFKRLGTLQLLYYQASIAFLFLLFPAIFSFLSRWKTVSLSHEKNFLLLTSIVVLLGAIIALALNICDLLMVSYTSALTCTIIGTIKTAVVVGVSWLAFRNIVSILNLIGYIICLLGVVLYNWIKYQKMKAVELTEEYQVVLPDRDEQDRMIECTLSNSTKKEEQTSEK
eukprot:jgi/Galph1/3214/GphlegSOOS_G1866.1